jgi:hypothetical protein
MATLEQRLAKLEAIRTRRSIEDDPPPAAVGRLMDALRKALPDDAYEYEEREWSRLVIRPPGWKSHDDKLCALAARIEAGELGEEDTMLLGSLPPDDLECLGMTAPELVTMLERFEAMY